jgi:SAM-dependent methyltransferase
MVHDPAVSATLDHVLADIADSRNYNEWLFSRARTLLGGRVLDAGAGIGTFTALAAATGAQVTALEPDPAFVSHLRERFADNPRVSVVEASAEAIPGLAGFDSVLCLNVLEHVHADEAALRGFHDALRPGGRLLLLVPAHPWLYGGYDRAAGHERRYGARTLRGRLRSAGFDVETLRHVNPLGGLGWLVRVRLLRGDEWPSASFRAFDRLVPAVRHLDRVRFRFGLSLWAIARRPSDA